MLQRMELHMLMQASLSQVMNVLFFFFLMSQPKCQERWILTTYKQVTITSFTEYEKSLHTTQNLGVRKDGSLNLAAIS